MKKKILIVDDSEFMRTLLQRILIEKYDVITAENPIAAMMVLIDYIPNLIISDINMPELSGYEFVKQLKANDIYKDISIIILSGIDKSEEKIRFLKLGICDYLEKPFSPEELLIRIERICKI